MSKARQLADLLDSNGDVVVGALDNAPDPDLTPYATTTYVDTEISGVSIDALDVNASAPADAIAIDANGRVGIGTSTPVRDLQVGDNSGPEVLSIQSSPGTDGSLMFGDDQTTAAEYRGMIRYSHSSDNMRFWTSSTERMVITSGGDLQFNSGYGSFATAYGCRAFVNFNGVSNPPSIRRSGNVSTVTDNGTGDYTINFTTAMVDSDYTATAMGRVWPGVQSEGFVVAFANYSADGASQRTTTSLRVVALNQVTNRTDSPSVGVAIFR